MYMTGSPKIRYEIIANTISETIICSTFLICVS